MARVLEASLENLAPMSEYALLNDLIAPAKPAMTSYGDFVEVRKFHLKPKPVIIAERFHFHRRQQKV